MLAPDWAQKILCIIVPNRRTVSPEFFSGVRTPRLLSRSRLVWINRRAFCMRMRQYGLLKCPRGIFCEFLRSPPAFAGCFLELNDVYWVLRSTNVFFKVSRHFYDQSEFIVASLSPLRGQSFLS